MYSLSEVVGLGCSITGIHPSRHDSIFKAALSTRKDKARSFPYFTPCQTNPEYIFIIWITKTWGALVFTYLTSDTSLDVLFKKVKTCIKCTSRIGKETLSYILHIGIKVVDVQATERTQDNRRSSWLKRSQKFQFICQGTSPALVSCNLYQPMLFSHWTDMFII